MRFIYLLLAVSIGLNAGLIITTLSDRREHELVGGPPPPAGQYPAPPRDPEMIVEDHVRGMTRHLDLTAEQQDAVRQVLRREMPGLLRARAQARDSNQRLAGGFAAPEFDPARFLELALEAAEARSRVDSASAVLLMAEAALLTAEQRSAYATVVPSIHSDPRRAPPPR